MNESNIMLGGKEESSGATIGTIIVIIILLIGGGYILWSRQGGDNMPITPATETSTSTEPAPVDPVSAQMGTQSQSANLADIEADLKATNLAPLDQDLKNVNQAAQ